MTHLTNKACDRYLYGKWLMVLAVFKAGLGLTMDISRVILVNPLLHELNPLYCQISVVLSDWIHLVVEG